MNIDLSHNQRIMLVAGRDIVWKLLDGNPTAGDGDVTIIGVFFILN
jgi:hypothetical protein